VELRRRRHFGAGPVAMGLGSRGIEAQTAFGAGPVALGLTFAWCDVGAGGHSRFYGGAGL
jgi:hypothetical protein